MVGDTILIKDISINGNNELTDTTKLSETLTDNTINALGVDASSRTIWVNGQPYGNAYVNIKEDNTVESPIGAEIFNDFANNVASGEYSHAEGVRTTAAGNNSHAEGKLTVASEQYSHAEGYNTKASGIASHAEGHGESSDNPNLAQGNYSHVEGEKNKALGIAAHSEGGATVATGDFSHSEGRFTRAYGPWSHAEGGGVEGDEDNYGAFGPISHCEGYATITYSGANSAHAEGRFTEASNMAEHACGIYNKSTNSSDASQATHFSIGIGTSNTNRKNAVEIMQDGKHYIYGIGGYNGTNPVESKDLATILSTVDTSDTTEFIVEKDLKVNGQTYLLKTVAAGKNTEALGYYSHAEGDNTKAAGNVSHAEGYKTETGGNYDSNEKFSYPVGENGLFSHAEGNTTIAQGAYSHAEGTLTFTKGVGSHAEGYKTEAKGDYSHAEGYNTEANGNYSHVTGSYNIAEGENSTLQGYCLFDHGIDTEDSFIWLQEPNEVPGGIPAPPVIDNAPTTDNTTLPVYGGCGYIRIGKQYIVDPGQNVIDSRIGYYRVTGLYYTKDNPTSNWTLKIWDDGSEYYISSEDLTNIINSNGWDNWTKESPVSSIPLTSSFTIFKYAEDLDTNVKSLSKFTEVQGCGWIYTASFSENYKNRILGVDDVDLKSLYGSKHQLNTSPKTFTNDNVTIIGKYNKPQPNNIFEVGCGEHTSDSVVTQKTAISVNMNGETTISKLNTGRIITTANNANTVSEQIGQLPEVGLDFRSIICSDGILIGISRMKYMYLKINNDGNIILGNIINSRLQEVNLTSSLTGWNTVSQV